MLPNDRRLLPERRIPVTHWTQEERQILRLIASIQFNLSEENDPKERVALYLDLRAATAQAVALASLPLPSKLEEIKENEND